MTIRAWPVVVFSAAAGAAGFALSNPREEGRQGARDRAVSYALGGAAAAVAFQAIEPALHPGAGLGMHPLHPGHPYNNGHSALGGLGQEPGEPWYKSPIVILGGIGLVVFLTTRKAGG
jgi:hypothetical protein